MILRDFIIPEICLGTSDDAGMVFPPRDEWDIAAYDTDEVAAGFLEYSADEPNPGPNRTPGYRWGWLNRRRDTTHEPDGFELLRFAYIRMARRPN
mgnify:CR=1 FL=1